VQKISTNTTFTMQLLSHLYCTFTVANIFFNARRKNIYTFNQFINKQKKLKKMKNLDLNAYGVQEMNHQEMVETDGGGLLLGVIIVGGLLLLTGCGSKGSGSNNQTTTVIITNPQNTTVIVNGDTVKKP